MLTWFLLLVGAFVGSLVGSFLNVVIWRGPALWGLTDDGEAPRGSLFGLRSYCPYCHTLIKARHNIPLVSFVALNGRCSNCSIAIPRRYPIVESLGAVVGVGAVWVFGVSFSGIFAALFLWSVIVIAAIDWETGFIPDAITFPLILCGLVANAYGLFISFADALIGALAGYFILWGVAAAYKAIRGRDGMGLGDAKLLGAIGAWVGWALLPVIVFVAAASALLVLYIAKLSGKKIHNETVIAFGPSLALAGSIVFLHQQSLALSQLSIVLH